MKACAQVVVIDADCHFSLQLAALKVSWEALKAIGHHLFFFTLPHWLHELTTHLFVGRIMFLSSVERKFV